MQSHRLHRSLGGVAVLTALAIAYAPSAAAHDALFTGVPGSAGTSGSFSTAMLPTSAESTTTWTLAPADEEGADGRVSLRHEIEPGARAEDAVELTNFSEHAATFTVYASDGIVTESGDFDLLSPDEQPERGGAWVTLQSDSVDASSDGRLVLTVDPGATAIVDVDIAVPENATPGDHPAGIVAQLVPGEDSDVQLMSRVGVRAHLRVAGDILASLVPTDPTATYTPSWNPFAPGHVRVDYAIDNAGNVRLGAEASTALAGPFGIAATTAEASVREILPASAATRSVELEVWPLFLSWGEISVAPVVVGEDTVALAGESADTTFTVWTIPWSQIALLALLVGGFFLVRIARRRGRRRVQERIDAAVAQARAESPALGTSADTAAAPAEPVEDHASTATGPVDSRTTRTG